MRPYYHDAAAGITIYHGDCRHLTLPERPALVLADPPYGDAHDTDYTRFSNGKRSPKGHEYTHHAMGAVAGDDKPFDPAPLLALGSECILFGANRYSDRLPTGSWIVWDKRTPGLEKGVMSDGEVAWWSRGRGVYIFNHMWDGFRRKTEQYDYLHPTQKPVALMRWCLTRARLAPGALVYDPYMGSGPVAQACKELGYRYIGVELVEAYAEIAARRLSQEVMALEG